MTTPPGQPNMELPEDLDPVFSNVARISHTPSEVVLDFARLLPGQITLPVLSRLVMAPLGAKLLLRALTENLARYEAVYGEIRLPGDNTLATDLFRRIHPPDAPPES